MTRNEDKRDDYPETANNGKTPFGEAGDTLEKAVKDVTTIGANPDYHHFSELEQDESDMKRLRRLYQEAERLLSAYSNARTA